MIKLENVEVMGIEGAIRGMRNPKDSWDKSDSTFETNEMGTNAWLGKNDLELAHKLARGGSVHAKYRRMITVCLDITSNHTFWAEFDTYKVGTVRNSCSKMHTIHIKEITKDMFSHEGVDEVGGTVNSIYEMYINEIEHLRQMFNVTGEKKYWRALIDMLPMGFNLKATVLVNYETLSNIYTWRRNHKMFEWVEFCKWIETLPYAKEIILTKEREDE